jgi:DNA invertase Pin-like site-specific DNA recombinase
MNEKIRPEHLQRAAYVYIRQSTAHQVRFHLEGQKRQYGLSQRAQELGFTQVVVIDEDLGRSGSGLQERPGFGRLLAAVCQGAVGAVVALEASRLARNNRDWHHLVDLCGLTDTLLIDDDGIYDPKLLNDRLLLGLKGTMSEFELGLFRQRARQAFLQKAKRGCALWEVPVGFVRTAEGQIEKSPDRQVQQAIEAVFGKFNQLGSVRQKRCSGFAKNRSSCRRPSRAAQASQSPGCRPRSVGSIRCSVIPVTPGPLFTGAPAPKPALSKAGRSAGPVGAPNPLTNGKC